MVSTPVALFIFNRPDKTAEIFSVIKAVQPARLFIVADGPRPGNPHDIELCNQARDVVREIHWKCNVSRIYASQNKGCRDSVPDGLTRIFSQVEDCIILEDDCLPDPCFFEYCTCLLDHYRQVDRIMTIGGHRSDGPDEFDGASYFFSKYPATWGWATWRRTWELFDLDMKEWRRLRDTSWLADLFNNVDQERYWKRIFDNMNAGLNAWDYALTYSCWMNDGISIRPKVNMISNIGFGIDATHTKEPENNISLRKAKSISFPLIHPEKISLDPETENRIEWVTFSGMTQRTIEQARLSILAKRKKICEP